MMFFRKSRWSFLFFLIAASSWGVDLNPLYNHKKLEVNFNYGVLAEFPRELAPSTNGTVENQKKSFINGGLLLKQKAGVVYQFPADLAAPDFTFWFFFNTNNVENNTDFATLSNGTYTLTLGFNRKNGYPYLAATDGTREIVRLQTLLHVDGEAWRLFCIRKRGRVCELLVNGAVQGQILLPEKITGKFNVTLTLNGKRSADNNETFNRYDNIFFYDCFLDDSTMKTHYGDEMRTHSSAVRTKTLPRPEPSEYVYEFDASGNENILRNGSFEHGLKGWNAETPDIRGMERRGRIRGNAPDGNYRIELSAATPVIQHYPIYIRKPGEFTIDFIAKGTKGSSIFLTVKRLNTYAQPRKAYCKKFTLSENFSRFSVSGQFPKNAKGFMLEFYAPEGAALDDVRMYGGASPEGKHPVQNTLMIDTVSDYNVFLDDEPLKFRIFRTSPGLQGELTISDEKDAEVYRAPIPAGVTEITIPFLRKGAFRAVVRCGGRVTDEHTFARLHANKRPGVELSSRYGAHYINTPKQLGFARLIGSHWNRNHDSGPYIARWNAKTKPMDGTFQYRFDVMDLNREYGQEILATLTGPWKEKESSPEEFAANVKKMIQEYKGRLRYIEFFNEPTAWFPASRYADFLKAGFKAAKEADPNVTILGLSTWDVVADFTKNVMERASCSNLDAFSAHFYNWGEGAWLIPDGTWGQGFRMRKLRNYLDSLPGGRKLPIWETESGIYMDSFYLHFPHQQTDNDYIRASCYPHHPPRLGAVWMAQFFPVNFANGAEKATYYAWGPTVGGIFRMNGHNMGEIDGSLKPSAAAFSASAHFLDFSEFIEGVDDLSPSGIRAFQFRRNGKNMVVAWTQGSKPLYFERAPALFFDYMGNPGDPAKLSKKAFLNYNGFQKEYEIPPSDQGKFYLDLEPKYFPDTTLDDFLKQIPLNMKKYKLWSDK